MQKNTVIRMKTVKKKFPTKGICSCCFMTIAVREESIVPFFGIAHAQCIRFLLHECKKNGFSEPPLDFPDMDKWISWLEALKAIKAQKEKAILTSVSGKRFIFTEENFIKESLKDDIIYESVKKLIVLGAMAIRSIKNFSGEEGIAVAL